MRALAALLLLGACGEAAGVEHVSSSSSIVSFEGALYVASPDDSRVVAIDPDSLEVRRVWDVPGTPHHLLVVGDALYVSLEQRGEVRRLEGGEWRATPVDCGSGAGMAALADGTVLVACPREDRVARLDGESLRVPGPRRLGVRDDEVLVATRTGSVFHGPWGELRETPLVTEEGFAATQLEGFALDVEGRIGGAYQRVDHDSDRDRDPRRGGYGSVEDGEPRIEPRIFGSCAGRYAVFDGGARVFSGPSAVALLDGTLLVANLYTDDVAWVRCGVGGFGSGGRRLESAGIRVGRGPRGIAVHEGRVYVDVAFDHAIARFVPGDAEAFVRRREPGPTTMSEQALRGRNLFHDAVDTHLTPSGVVTCATCHPGGGEDGLVWFLHTRGVPRKLRRTPPAWGAREGLRPFHWDGEFEDAATLSATTIRELMEGDGLLVDLEALAAYMAEVPLPPAGGGDSGREVFESAGCAECHAGALGADGRTHAVVAQSADPDARLSAVSTPPLRGVRGRAPFLHDGRAPTLRSVLVEHNAGDRHGVTSTLSELELDALVTYLESR